MKTRACLLAVCGLAVAVGPATGSTKAPVAHFGLRVRFRRRGPCSSTQGTEILEGATQEVTLDDNGEALVVVRIHFHSDPFVATASAGSFTGTGTGNVGGRPDEDAPFPCP